MKKILLILLLLPLLALALFNIKKEYKTKNVIVVVVDGAEYIETWGDPDHKNIPLFSNNIAKNGIVNTNFYNYGKTTTICGFTSLLTGVYQRMDGSKKKPPMTPSIFQYFLKSNQFLDADKAWFIGSKRKLSVLANTQHQDWKNKYIPSINFITDTLDRIGRTRDDTLTLLNLFHVLDNYQPNLVVVGFKEPDMAAHAEDRDKYLAGIKRTDRFIYDIWDYINHHPLYSGTTTLFITNDHGRHSNNIMNGFYDHGLCFKEEFVLKNYLFNTWKIRGSSCEGCQHINFFAYGPDFKTGIINKERELIDIPATIAELLQFDGDYIDGEVMYELFK